MHTCKRARGSTGIGKYILIGTEGAIEQVKWKLLKKSFKCLGVGRRDKISIYRLLTRGGAGAWKRDEVHIRGKIRVRL